MFVLNCIYGFILQLAIMLLMLVISSLIVAKTSATVKASSETVCVQHYHSTLLHVPIMARSLSGGNTWMSAVRYKNKQSFHDINKC